MQVSPSDEAAGGEASLSAAIAAAVLEATRSSARALRHSGGSIALGLPGAPPPRVLPSCIRVMHVHLDSAGQLHVRVLACAAAYRTPVVSHCVHGAVQVPQRLQSAHQELRTLCSAPRTMLPTPRHNTRLRHRPRCPHQLGTAPGVCQLLILNPLTWECLATV